MKNTVKFVRKTNAQVIAGAAASLFIVGCASISVPPCRMSDQELSTYPKIGQHGVLETGMLYRFAGTFYRMHHDIGLVPTPFFGWDNLEIQRYESFCVRVNERCDISGGEVAEIIALVRFIGPEREKFEPGINRCWSGTLEIERIVHIRWNPVPVKE